MALWDGTEARRDRASWGVEVETPSTLRRGEEVRAEAGSEM